MKSYIRWFILVGLVVSWAGRGGAQGVDVDVDAFVRGEMERRHIPGLSLAVVKDGAVVKAAGYGMANLELRVPAGADTVYKIGSVSKQFIASGVMLLVQEGKVALDDKVSRFLEGTPATWKGITVRQVLTHTSGIVREAPGFNGLRVQPDAAVIKTAYGLPLRFAPGEKWEYCNVGYFILAEIIRKVSGKAWGEFIGERIFAPAKMADTRTTTVTDLVSRRAGGYAWKGDHFENAQEYLALRPSGAFLSTVLDLAKWDAALNQGSALTPETLKLMWTPVTLNDGKTMPYGFGWQLEPYQGHKAVHHGGSLPGFRAEMARFVDDHVTVIVLVNLDGGNPDRIAQGVATFYVAGMRLGAAGGKKN